jgi:membrane protease YdiL (CAAX protease family)
MSKDSSKVVEQVKDAESARSVDGWRAAVLSLLGVLFIYFILPTIVGLIIYLYPLSKHWTDQHAQDWLNNSVPAQFIFILVVETLTVLTVFGLLKWFRWSKQSIGLSRPQIWQPLVGIAAALPYFILYLALISAVTALVPSLNIDQKQEICFNSVNGNGQLILTFISLVILPPIAEEITMRGFLYTGLRKWLPKLASALVVSVLFGAAHLAEGGAAGPLWVAALDTFVLSMVLVYLREKTGSLWAGMTLHALKNLVAFVGLFIVAGR